MVSVPGSLSFSALRDGPLGETWDFDLFSQDTDDTDPFAWLCGKFWIPTAHAEPANGTLEILISPHAYRVLQAAFAEADFFTLPTSLNPSALTMPRYIIEATRTGQTHRVTLDAPATLSDTLELARFQTLWSAFNALLPLRLQIELAPE